MEWHEALAGTFGVEPLGPEEVTDLLEAARDVAHGVERKVTPLATFLVGMAVERRVAQGASRTEALSGALAEVRGSIPS